METFQNRFIFKIYMYYFTFWQKKLPTKEIATCKGGLKKRPKSKNGHMKIIMCLKCK